MNLVERIKKTAKERAITIKDLSIKAGIGPKTISNWSNHNPQTETLKKVADVLGVSVDYLLGNTDEKNPIKANNDKEEIDLKELTDIENIKHRAVSFGGEPMTDHDAKLIQQYLETLFEGR